MARTKGSGWGGGTLLYQICPECGRKKVIYENKIKERPFLCTWCRERFYNSDLIQKLFRSQLQTNK